MNEWTNEWMNEWMNEYGIPSITRKDTERTADLKKL